jgi:hypothetical protein
MGATYASTGYTMAYAAKNAADNTLTDIVNSCIKNGKVMPRVKIGVYGYSGHNPGEVDWAIPEFAYDNDGLVCITELANASDEYQDPITEKYVYSLVEEKANGGTPMGKAFDDVVSIVENFAQNNPNAHPPIVINITDADPTDLDPNDLKTKVQAVKNIATTDGNALVWNIHISNSDTNEIICPDEGTSMPDHLADAMLAASSSLPPSHIKMGEARKLPFGESPKCFVYNADGETLTKCLSFASSVTDQ